MPEAVNRQPHPCTPESPAIEHPPGYLILGGVIGLILAVLLAAGFTHLTGAPSS
jgi:hypothetical protein